MTKNLTLAIDDDLLDRARVVAAVRRTTVNAMVREFLERVVQEEREGDAVTQALLKLSREGSWDMGDWTPSRDETYSGSPRFDR
jgi:plasmid stability protein